MADEKKTTSKDDAAKAAGEKAEGKKAEKKDAAKAQSSSSKKTAAKKEAPKAESKKADAKGEKKAAKKETKAAKKESKGKKADSKAESKKDGGKKAAGKKEPAKKAKAKAPAVPPVVRAKARYVRVAPRKARLVAHEVGVAVDLPVDDPRVDGSAIRKVNPLAQFPTLVLDDGTGLYQSPVICEYLDSLHNGPKLYPPAGPARWEVLKRDAIGQGILEWAVPLRHERIRPAELQSRALMDKHTAALLRIVDHLDGAAAGFRGFDIGALSIANALDYVDFRFADLTWRHGRQTLAAWHETIARRPSFATIRLHG